MDNTCVDCGERCGPTSMRCRQCSPKASAAERAERLRGKPKSPEHRAAVTAGLLARGERERERRWDECFVPGDPDDCWEWTGTRLQGSSDYGRIGRRTAHVVSWERANGRPVPDGLCVLHHCDHPPCVNPAHLYVGTHADNARDRTVRGRGVRGERVNTNKLTEADVRAIRRACDGGEMQRRVADRFGVTQTMVSFIARRKSWAWLPEGG